MSNLQAAHQLRLQQLLESGRLTPAASPTPDQQPASAATTATSSPAKARGSKKRARMNLEALAESTPEFLPDSMNYIVCVSSRSPDVLLENDHSLHCLCSFPTRQAAHDWVLKNRLALARHYLLDPRLSPSELQASAQADGCEDEYYLGEHTSLEIIQVPQFKSAESAPDASVQNLLFNDHFITNREEEEFEESQQKNGGDEEEGKESKDSDAEMKGEGEKKAKATSSPKRTSKRRKI